MGKIDWSKAPHWADRVVCDPSTEKCYWANDCQRKEASGPTIVGDVHIVSGWEVVERRPTVDTVIDWSKAPHWADRVVRSPRKSKLFLANDNERQALDDSRFGVDSQHVRDNWEVVERRPARPPETSMCRCVAAPVSRTIEQRIASLHALEKQIEETRAELTRDLESLGLTWMVRGEPGQPTITDWRDLRVGDVVEITSSDNESWVRLKGEHLVVTNIGPRKDVTVSLGDDYWMMDDNTSFRFIRRP